MRLINDNPEQKTGSSEPVNLFSLPFYALMCALGFSSIVMSPLAVIWVHRKLPEYWPKVVSIVGAVIALLFLDAPVTAVLLSFVVGVFVADNVKRQVPVWGLLFRSSILAATLAIIALGVKDQMGDRVGLLTLWTQLVSKGVQQAQEGGLVVNQVDWEQIRQVLFYQGPFYFLSGTMLSVWLSLGLAAHLKWQTDDDLYSAKKMRSLRLPWFISLIALVLWGASFLVQGTSPKMILAGVLNLVLSALFIQGTVLLSMFLDQKRWGQMVRTLIYTLFVFVGFYALAGLGLMSPLILIKKKRQDLTPTKTLEEAV
jgi:hypothetical protein